MGWVQPGTSDLKGDQGWQQCKGDEKVGWVQPGDLTQAQLPTGDRLGFERWSGWQQWVGDEEMGWVQPGDLSTADLNGGQGGSSRRLVGSHVLQSDG